MKVAFILLLLVCVVVGADAGMHGTAWSLAILCIAAIIALQIGFALTSAIDLYHH